MASGAVENSQDGLPGTSPTVRGAGGDDGVAHALDVHFGPGETGEVAPGAEVDGHGSAFCRLEFKR